MHLPFYCWPARRLPPSSVMLPPPSGRSLVPPSWFSAHTTSVAASYWPKISCSRLRTASPTADLALLKLSKQLPTGLAPAFLGTRAVAVSDRLIVIGYGVATQGDNKSAGTPRMATLTVTAHSDNLITLRDAGSGNISGCTGDSGAPAFAMRGGVPALVGVVSRGHCGDSSLVIPFARYRDWIFETARRFGSPLDP